MTKNSSHRQEISQASLVGQIADEYLARLERGEQPRIDEYVERHPQLADVLRTVLSAVQVMLPSASDPVLTDEDDAAVSISGGILGDYRISRQIGRGGMGIVYEAEQLSLGRRVALKVLPFAAMLDPKQFQRFKNEAQAAAGLHHPHIVPVYSVGCERGVHHYAMQFIEGLSLAELVEQMRNLCSRGERDAADSCYAPSDMQVATTHPIAALSTARSGRSQEYFQTVARLGMQAAQALEHAHQVGVVHRDIKPGNLLVDLRGNLWITDFGLARFKGDAGLTMTGDLVGTLRYMSPEQAQGKPGLVDHRTDIYSLGATLYELMALEPAHRGRDREALLREIGVQEPTPPRHIDGTIPADLETVVLKALSQEPEDRYASAAAMAEDLRRFLEHKPVLAQPPGIAKRAARWARRHAPLVSVGAVTLLVIVTILGVSMTIIARQRNQANAERLRAEAMAEQIRQRLYAADVKLAYQTWSNADVQGALQLLDRQRPGEGRGDLRGFEWYYLMGLCQNERARLAGHQGEVYFVTFSPDGKRLASASQDGTVKLWDAATRQPLLTLRGHTGEVTGTAFSPDGKLLASTGQDQCIRLWNTDTGQEMAVLRGHTNTVFNAVFSPDGKLLAAGESQGLVKLWDVEARREIATIRAHIDDVEHLAFSPDGQLLATAGGEHFPPEKPAVKLWDVATREMKWALRGHEADVQFVAFSGDGKTLASASSDHMVKLWDVSTGRGLATLRGHTRDVHGLSFSPDGATIASASRDGTVRLWDVESGRARQGLGGHLGRVWSVAFSPDGQRLATAGADGTLRLWDPGVPGRRKLPIDGQGRTAARLSPDGLRLATWDASRQAKQYWHVWNGITGEPELDTLGGELMGGVTFTAFSADSQIIATGHTSGRLCLWNLPEGSRRLTFEGDLSTTPLFGCLSPDGRWLADSLGNVTVRIWDAKTGKLRSVLDSDRGVLAVEFSPHSSTLATAGADGSAGLWNPATRRAEATLVGHRGAVNSIAFSANGALLATASDDFTLRLWDAHSHQLIASLSGHGGPVHSAAFSPDGKTLASGSDDHTIRLWHVPTGQELIVLEGHSRPVTYVAFYPDGRRLVSLGSTADGPGEFYVWSASNDPSRALKTSSVVPTRD